MAPIKFEHIPEVGLSIEQDFSSNKLSELLDEPERTLHYRALEPAHITFNLERTGRDVQLTGGGNLLLSHPCVRCLEDLQVKHALIFDLKIETPEVIDLEAALREELFLELPLYPACEPACAS